MPHPEKAQLVAEVSGQFREAGSVFIADYAGLTVADMTELRKQLREAGTRLRVVKNTLLRRAANDAGLPELAEFFKGPTAVGFGPADPVVTAKIFHEFAVRIEKPKMRRFVIGHQPFGAGELRALASLPPRAVMLSYVVASVQAPIANLIGTLDGIVRELIGTVDALSAKKDVA